MLSSFMYQLLWVFLVSSSKKTPATEYESVSTVGKECPKGEHYDQCMLYCQRNCSNWDMPVIVCPVVCVPACICDEGTVRGEDGRCIQPDQCPKKEDISRESTGSTSAIKCPESDTVLPYPGDCTRFVTCRDFRAHIRGCPPGMKFHRGLLRCRYPFETHKCDNSIAPHKTCGSNEEYLECGPSCEKTCDEYRNDYLDCPEECVKGCFCKKGLVRGSLHNCVHPRKCGNRNILEPWFLINSRTKTISGEEVL